MKAAKAIADMSASAQSASAAFPGAHVPTIVPARSPRTEQSRRAKQRQRERERAAGLTTVPVMLTAAEAQLLVWLRTAQAGSEAQFYARALVVGAKFVYNSGNVRGGKRRIKSGAAWPIAGGKPDEYEWGTIEQFGKRLVIHSRPNVRRCRECGCTQADCRRCIEKTGAPCSWVEKDLCSACVVAEVLREPLAGLAAMSEGARKAGLPR